MIEPIKRAICYLRTKHVYLIYTKYGLKQCGWCGELREDYDDNLYKL
jgi:hypothetical protein